MLITILRSLFTGFQSLQSLALESLALSDGRPLTRQHVLGADARVWQEQADSAIVPTAHHQSTPLPPGSVSSVIVLEQHLRAQIGHD